MVNDVPLVLHLTLLQGKLPQVIFTKLILFRIGLSPICGAESRQILFNNKECLQNISKIPAAAQCQSGLQFLGKTVELMIQGIHSEALLCNTFYMLRNTFECGETLVKFALKMLYLKTWI